MAKNNSELEIRQRAEGIKEAIDALKREKSEIEASGWVAPADCYIARYQAKGQKYHYWYYQLKASKAVFPKANKKGEFSRFKHLGKAGSQAHIDGVNAVIRRTKIEALNSAIESLYESWLDLYPDEKKAGHRVE
jgi:tRNA U38,U39,U40 pseudouridine synthase TruA